MFDNKLGGHLMAIYQKYRLNYKCRARLIFVPALLNYPLKKKSIFLETHNQKMCFR